MAGGTMSHVTFSAKSAVVGSRGRASSMVSVVARWIKAEQPCAQATRGIVQMQCRSRDCACMHHEAGLEKLELQLPNHVCAGRLPPKQALMPRRRKLVAGGGAGPAGARGLARWTGILPSSSASASVSVGTGRRFSRAAVASCNWR